MKASASLRLWVSLLTSIGASLPSSPPSSPELLLVGGVVHAASSSSRVESAKSGYFMALAYGAAQGRPNDRKSERNDQWGGGRETAITNDQFSMESRVPAQLEIGYWSFAVKPARIAPQSLPVEQ